MTSFFCSSFSVSLAILSSLRSTRYLPGLAGEGGGAVLEELLLSMVEAGRHDAEFLAQVRDTDLFEQIPSHGRHLVLVGEVSSLSSHHELLRFPSCQRPGIPVSAEAKQGRSPARSIDVSRKIPPEERFPSTRHRR